MIKRNYRKLCNSKNEEQHISNDAIENMVTNDTTTQFDDDQVCRRDNSRSYQHHSDQPKNIHNKRKKKEKEKKKKVGLRGGSHSFNTRKTIQCDGNGANQNQNGIGQAQVQPPTQNDQALARNPPDNNFDPNNGNPNNGNLNIQHQGEEEKAPKVKYSPYCPYEIKLIMSGKRRLPYEFNDRYQIAKEEVEVDYYMRDPAKNPDFLDANLLIEQQ